MKKRLPQNKLFNRRVAQSFNAENRKDLYFNVLSLRPFASFFVSFAFL